MTSPDRLAPTFAPRSSDTSPGGASSVIRALDVLSDPWSFLILREAFFGVRRFDDLQASLMIARNVLTDRLAQLIADGALERRQYSERPARFEYRLTQAGRDFYPAIVALMAWGDRWRPHEDGPPLSLIHGDDGHLVVPQVVCAACREPVLPFDVALEDGPGAGPEPEPATVISRRRGGDDMWLRGRPCSVARTLQVIGDRWSMRILRQCFVGLRRFDEFQSSLGIARNILTERLQRLVDQNILERRQYQARPDRFDYVLAPAGLDLYPSFLLLMAWGDRWRAGSNGPPLLLRHKACGCIVRPVLSCATCGEEVIPAATTYRMHYSYPFGVQD